MANSKQAIKRARQNSDKYKLRHAQRSVVRTAVKAVREGIETNDKPKATESFKKAQKVIDTAASRKVIHKNLIPRLSERFFRASDVKSKNIDGSGLGLAIVTKVINDHNSVITFNSINQGAKVEIVFPKYYD